MQGKREERNNQDFMSLEGFGRYLKIGIQQILGNGTHVLVQEVTKNNNVKLQCLTILEDEYNLSPNIYLDFYYNHYLNGRSLEDIEQDILEVYREEKISAKIDMSFFTEWEEIKKRIVFKLVNFEQNRELLKDVPYIRFLDLMVVPHCLLVVKEENYATTLIHKKHLELWNVTAQEVLNVAQQNTPKLLPFEMKNMTEVISEIFMCEEKNSIPKECMETEVIDMKECSMYVLTNQYKLNGAACILYHDVLADFANELNCDLYILPSSVHEVLLIPVRKEERDSVGLSEIVKEVNSTQLLQQDILSDHVYKFSRETEMITMEGVEDE